MAKFIKGDTVLNIETGERGVIVDIFPARRGRQIYSVKWAEGINDEFEEDLKAEFNISDPFTRCENGVFDSYADFQKINTSFKIKNSNNNTISSLAASKTLFRAYQFKPLLKFLNSPNRRLLVADEVGLGKTIEAGHIMMELKARNALKNVLIVCPKSLQKKWKDELLFKFGLNFNIYEHSSHLINELKAGTNHVFAIINYEKIQQKKAKDDPKLQDKNIIEYLSSNSVQFGLVVCDEAHKLRNRTTQWYKGAEIIMSHSDSALFLTATPVMISTENLYNLLHLLDNSRYFKYEIFQNRLEENRPFVEALSSLNHRVPFKTILKQLQGEEIRMNFSISKRNYVINRTLNDVFKDDPVYNEIIDLLNNEDTPKTEARLQYLLSTMSVMNSVFSRTRKRDVTQDMSLAERRPFPRNVVLCDFERSAYDDVIDTYIADNSYTTFWGDEYLSQGATLGLVQKKRQVASSVFAYLNDERSLDRGVDEYEEYQDAKFEELIKIFEDTCSKKEKKLVVFAVFRKTIKYLQVRLKKRGYDSLAIHGGVENRNYLLDEFRDNPKIKILLSSEVGSEGLDMQFCDTMVNYDLPWNPMVVEQRIGRIDRFGQKSPFVNIYNLIVADSIQEDIYMRLLERIGIFRGTIGDLEAILDASYNGTAKTIQEVYNKLEKEILTSNLTKEERNRKVADIERAIESEKENLNHLERELSNTLTNDAYFQDEINKIRNNNAYVTEKELHKYVSSAIQEEIPTCTLEDQGNGIYQLLVPSSNPKTFKNFIIKYKPFDDEIDRQLSKVFRDFEDNGKMIFTFNQDVAYNNSKLMFVNIYNPIIRVCLEYFLKKEDKTKTTFSFGLNPGKNTKSGDAFYMALYQLSTIRTIQGREKKTDILLPLLYDINNCCIIGDERITDSVFGASQTLGFEYNHKEYDISSEMISDMRFDFAEKIKEVIASRKKELVRETESDAIRNEKQTNEYYNARIQNMHEYILEWEMEQDKYSSDSKDYIKLSGQIRMAEAKIESLKKEMEERVASIRERQNISIKEQLIAINLIHIV